MKIIDDFLEEIKRFGMAKTARLSGVSINTIHTWVYKQRTPTLELAAKVADAMGLEFLLFEKED